jgi:hypothetical protein
MNDNDVLWRGVLVLSAVVAALGFHRVTEPMISQA